MPYLTVSQFSCIEYLEFETSPVTIIVGPQGSGKSVTTKLFYFFVDILSQHYEFAERGDSEELFKKSISKSFVKWFPPSAWGNKRFNITYTAGDFTARILRRRSGGQLSDEVTVSFSDWFSKQFNRSKREFEAAKKLSLDDDSAYDRSIETTYRVRDELGARIAKKLGEDYVSSQVFIPAGRAFFTSLGRFVAGFEGSGHLDPVTLRFAKLYASLRDRNSIMRLRMRRPLPEDVSNRRDEFQERVFGGVLKEENEFEFVEASGGRKIPFTALSSGQQELLPMWSMLEYFSQLDVLRSSARGDRSRSRELIYIEEPEAHLFPSAQSLLMEYIISSLTSERSNRSVILTTHSPYIMSKINVFIKAGQLARRKKVNNKINEVVPRECWLESQEVGAYALADGEMLDILDDDGLIDGSYLDQISEDISRQYSSLLMLESQI
ncbi:ATP-binding protein [Erythrobacter sp. SCSIO 43205]|uniref:AAA family ATPase n=1 Tax=Erythrobacter sp. SCSIO 43205 TaxID=2779361 RepID=UPI001CA9EB84|nr:ATP-binding protein [Erythrobacter sp. SCSIO 43205]UAB77435.1 ATP-binding protein [Erythrobacter sp. SCSIO 43205]